VTRVLVRRRESHPGGGRGRTGRRGAAQLRGLALRLADTLAEAQPILHTPQDSQPGPVFPPLGWVICDHRFMLSFVPMGVFTEWICHRCFTE
jgi:hypothetical protein